MTKNFKDFKELVDSYHRCQKFLAILNNGSGTLKLEGRGLVTSIELTDSAVDLELAEAIGKAFAETQKRRLKEIKAFAVHNL